MPKNQAISHFIKAQKQQDNNSTVSKTNDSITRTAMEFPMEISPNCAKKMKFAVSFEIQKLQ